MQKTTTNRGIILLILGFLSAIGPFSIDMYLPAFQTIATDFNTSVDKVQLSLTSFFIGIAFGQLIYGPLLDKYGRKKTPNGRTGYLHQYYFTVSLHARY